MAASETSFSQKDPTDETGIRLCKTSPKYLESNATSHSFPFSAIAELIDNAYDPDVRASQLRIEQRNIGGTSCLLFIDDGNGMTEEQLYRMLSFGFSDKVDIGDHKAIGRYGNGFKSGSMRLGKDALVFTKNKDTMSVGLLSQTYHQRINADTVRIPIVTYDRKSFELVEPKTQNEANLRAILKYSIFTTADELLDQLTSVPDFDSDLPTGTKIIVWNLRELAANHPELYFRQNIGDIVYNDPELDGGPAAFDCEPKWLDYAHSLKKFCSILYLRPRMKIFILGEKVKSRLIARDLCKTAEDKYTMKGEATLPLTFGFNPSRDITNDYGAMLYHNNRLIKAFEKVGYQKQHTEQGRGVVCVIEAEILTPNHNKQGFVADEKYHRVMNAVARKLNDYWDTKTALHTKQANLVPDCLWVQCDTCMKWRRLPGEDHNLEGEWYCTMHPSDIVARQGCRAPEDALVHGEVDLSSKYTYQREKSNVTKSREVKKRKPISSSTRKTLSAETIRVDLDQDSDDQDYEERATRPKRTRRGSSPQYHESTPRHQSPRRGGLNNVRRMLSDLHRQAQTLRAAPPSSVRSVADEVHVAREEHDHANTVLCVRCAVWKKLPVDYRVEDVAIWECKMHPEEGQRHCRVPINQDSSSDTLASLNNVEVNISSSVAGPSGIQRSSTNLDNNAQNGDSTVSLDDETNDEESEETDDVKAIQSQVNDLASVLSAVQQESRRPKLEPINVEACPNCPTFQSNLAALNAALAELAELKRKQLEYDAAVAIVLNACEVDPVTPITPETAFEAVKSMAKNIQDAPQ